MGKLSLYSVFVIMVNNNLLEDFHFEFLSIYVIFLVTKLTGQKKFSLLATDFIVRIQNGKNKY